MLSPKSAGTPPLILPCDVAPPLGHKYIEEGTVVVD